MWVNYTYIDLWYKSIFDDENICKNISYEYEQSCYDHIEYLSNPNKSHFQMVKMPFFNVEFVGKTSFETREGNTFCKRAIVKFAKLV